MTIGARVTYFADTLQERLSTALVWLGDVIAFLSQTAWPLVDLLIRIWIGKSALVLSVLISTDWTTVVRMAEGTYPIPDLSLGSTALLSQVYWLAAVSLILGLATRVGAAVLLALTVASHTRVAALDLNLFWMALLAYYVLLGADRLSLDRLLSQGLKNSPLPQAGAYRHLSPRPTRCAYVDAAAGGRPYADGHHGDGGDSRVAARGLGDATFRKRGRRVGTTHR